MNEGYANKVKAEFTCVACGYSIRGVAIDELCPECGTPIAQSLNRDKPTSGAAIAGMVLGIISILGCMAYGLPSIVCGPLAIYFSTVGKKQFLQGTVSPSSRGMATAGLVTGIIGTCLAVLGLGFVFIAILIPLVFP